MTNTTTPTPEKTKMSNGAGDYAKEKLKAAEVQANKVARETSEAIAETAEAASEHLSTLSQDVNAAVRKNPAMAVGVALGAGVLLGLALRGRS